MRNFFFKTNFDATQSTQINNNLSRHLSQPTPLGISPRTTMGSDREPTMYIKLIKLYPGVKFINTKHQHFICQIMAFKCQKWHSTFRKFHKTLLAFKTLKFLILAFKCQYFKHFKHQTSNDDIAGNGRP